MKKQTSVFVLLIVIISNLFSQQAEFPKLTGPYLGQKPPGRIPEIFAPGIISTGLYTRDITISKGGGEIYFSVADEAVTGIFVTKLIKGVWTEPAVASFSGKGFFDFEPHISPDGRKFFFLSTRPPHNERPMPGWYYQNIWMMNRSDNGWSEPAIVHYQVNSDEHEFFPSCTNDNILYFTKSNKGSKPRIYRLDFENGRFSSPEMVSLPIPESSSVFNAYVSPDEDYMITCAENIDSANTDQDYYISFKLSSRIWSPLIKFGPEINTPGDNAGSAYVSPDGKYLFFSSFRKDANKSAIKSGTTLKSIINSKKEPGYGSSAIYWVSAKIIEDLRPKK
jgi:hypothetical protein